VFCENLKQRNPLREMPSKKNPIDKNRIVAAVREILFAIGENPDREGLRETPHRVARMYQELFGGLHEDPAAYTKKFFNENYNEVVLVRDINFSSICEHHLMPFMGVVHIGYIPDGRVIGLSKLARVIEVFSHRPQLQERMTEDIAELLYKELQAKAVAVVIEAEHTCMTLRGVKKPGSLCVTSALRGGFLKHPSSRAEILALINKR
jgi:GTP cyclohydrolase I